MCREALRCARIGAGKEGPNVLTMRVWKKTVGLTSQHHPLLTEAFPVEAEQTWLCQ